MNLEIGQHGAYPAKEVRRIPVSAQTFTGDGGINRVFNNVGGTAGAFSGEARTSRAFDNAAETARVFDSRERANRAFNSSERTDRVVSSQEEANRVFNGESGTARTFTSEARTNRSLNSEGGTTSGAGKMGHLLTANANNNHLQGNMQRNISEVSSVFVAGSDLETDYNGNRRGGGEDRSEASRSSSTDGRLDRRKWITGEGTELKRHAVKQNPKGSLFGRWKTLNDEFQDKYVDYSSNAERGQTQVSRISDFDRFDNVRQVFSEGNVNARRNPLEENESKASSYQITTSKSYSVTEPAVSKMESLENEQSQTFRVHESNAKQHKKDCTALKVAKKKKERQLEIEQDAQYKRGKQIRVHEKKKQKKQKQEKTIEKKAAEFVDGLLEDAWAVCIPRRESSSLENLASTETQEKHIARSEKSRLAQTVQSEESSNHEDRARVTNSKQVLTSREEWLLQNSSSDGDQRLRQRGHFEDMGTERSSYTGEGSRGVNMRTRTGGHSTAESAAGMNVRTRVERFSSTAENAHDLRTREDMARGRGQRSSNSSSVSDVHRGGILEEGGHDLTHIIRPIPGSGSYTRMFSSHSRHGSGSSTDRRIRSHSSEGYTSDATPLPSMSRTRKVRLGNGQAVNHLVLEPWRSLEDLNSSYRGRSTLVDDNMSTTCEIRQRCWSYDNLSSDNYLDGSDHIASPSVTRDPKRNRPPTLTRGMITRVFHGCEDKLPSFSTTPSHSQFQQIDEVPRPQHNIRPEPHQPIDYTVFLPIKDTTDAPYHLDGRSIAVGRGTPSLEVIPYHLSKGRIQSASSSPMRFHHAASSSPLKFHHPAYGASPNLESPGTTFSNLPIFVADVLSPMPEEVYYPESRFEGSIGRQNTMASIISDDRADVHMTRDQVLNFYVFNQQTSEKTPQMQEITQSITLGDERLPTYSSGTQTPGNDQGLIQKYAVEKREAPIEPRRRIQPVGQKETVHYITQQREIETLPVKRNVESTSAQTDPESFSTPDTDWSSRDIPVLTKSVDALPETSSFDEYFEKNARYPVIFEEREALPVRVVMARESKTTAPVLPAEVEEEEEFVETTVVEEKEEKICMEIREEVEFSMLRKQGTMLDRDSSGTRASIEPWWIPDRYEAVVDRRKIKTTKTEQLHNDEDYSMKRERHHLKDQGTAPAERITHRYQTPGVQHQGRGTYTTIAADSRSGRVADTNPAVAVSGRRGIDVPQRNGIHRNHYFSRHQSNQSPDSLGVFGKALASSSTAWKTKEGRHSQNGGYGPKNRSQATESTGSGVQRIGSSYEPNNVSFGRKSDEMVLREMHGLGDSAGFPAVQDVTRATASSSAYNGGRVTFSSQSEPVAETKLIRDEAGNLVKVTERQHTMTKTVEYPATQVEEEIVVPRSVERRRIFDSSYDEGSFGMNSEASDTIHLGSSSEESDGMKAVKHFETMATPL